MHPDVIAFFHGPTNTISYLVADADSRHCAIIDPVLDFDPASGRTATVAADELIAAVVSRGLQLDWILETHPHADHLSAAPYIKASLGGATAIGAGIKTVQRTFKNLFNLPDEETHGGNYFDRYLGDGEQLDIGSLKITVMHTPGHTPACVTYHIGDAAFVGDTLFMPDYGTARCDFPGGDARTLYRSIRRVLSLPETTRLFMCHDYKSPTRSEYAWETTVAEQKRSNIHARDSVTEDEFVAMRMKRDATLSMPRLIVPAIQVNIRGGEFPAPEDNGIRYLKLPIDAL